MKVGSCGVGVGVAQEGVVVVVEDLGLKVVGRCMFDSSGVRRRGGGSCVETSSTDCDAGVVSGNIKECSSFAQTIVRMIFK